MYPTMLTRLLHMCKVNPSSDSDKVKVTVTCSHYHIGAADAGYWKLTGAELAVRFKTINYLYLWRVYICKVNLFTKSVSQMIHIIKYSTFNTQSSEYLSNIRVTYLRDKWFKHLNVNAILSGTISISTPDRNRIYAEKWCLRQLQVNCGEYPPTGVVSCDVQDSINLVNAP